MNSSAEKTEYRERNVLGGRNHDVQSSSLVKAVVGAAIVTATASAATAAVIHPTSYTFDQPNDCATYCYLDTTPPSKLTDGVLGDRGWAVGQGSQWDGWLYKPVVNIDFNFGSVTPIDQVDFGTTQDNLSDVVLPSLKVYSSSDGVVYTLVQSLIVPASNVNNNDLHDPSAHGFLTLSSLGINARYVRVQADSNGPWIFADEVIFRSGVPEPAAWALLLVGFAGLGGALRTRRAPRRRMRVTTA